MQRATGGRSEVTFRSYDAGVESFYGTKKDVVWLDEKAEQKIYAECLLRTLATVPGEPNGIMLLTFTLLAGMTELAKDFIRAEEISPKHLNRNGADGPAALDRSRTIAPEIRCCL
jgi:phage terminase large subunit-like protein